jgi:hypothetical protein
MLIPPTNDDDGWDNDDGNLSQIERRDDDCIALVSA